MKIGLMSSFPPEKCGVAIYSGNLLGHINKKINVITVGDVGSKADYKVDFKSFSLRRKLGEIVKKEKLDLLHIQYNAPHFSKWTLNFNLIWALNLGIPIIVTLHEVQYPQKASLIQKSRLEILKSIEKQLIKKITRIIVHTPNQKRFLETRYKVKNIKCIYHGLNLFEENKRKNITHLFDTLG